MTLKKFDSINVIPFIDIMLVLLTIVLTTATFINQGVIPISLPEGESTTQLPQEPIEITIDPSGKLFYQNESITLETLKTKLEQLNPDTPIMFRTDKSAAFEHFVSVIEPLKKLSFKNVSIITKH